MNAAKAIEILKLTDRFRLWEGYPDSHDAIKLGIEALKLYEYTRHIGQHVDPCLLPGETPGDASP